MSSPGRWEAQCERHMVIALHVRAPGCGFFKVRCPRDCHAAEIEAPLSYPRHPSSSSNTEMRVVICSSLSSIGLCGSNCAKIPVLNPCKANLAQSGIARAQTTSPVDAGMNTFFALPPHTISAIFLPSVSGFEVAIPGPRIMPFDIFVSTDPGDTHDMRTNSVLWMCRISPCRPSYMAIATDFVAE
jgi:hypothetical protein